MKAISWGVTLALIGAAQLYLTQIDRKSTPAMFAVELETRLSLPVGPTLLGVGVILLAWGLMPKPQKAPPPALRSRPSRAEGLGEGGDWLAQAREAVMMAKLGDGAEVVLTPGATPPVELRLRGLTPERARAVLEGFAELLLTLRPPRAKVRFIHCEAATTSRVILLRGALRQRLAEGAFTAVGSGDEVEVRLTAPDARWTEA